MHNHTVTLLDTIDRDIDTYIEEHIPRKRILSLLLEDLQDMLRTEAKAVRVKTLILHARWLRSCETGLLAGFLADNLIGPR